MSYKAINRFEINLRRAIGMCRVYAGLKEADEKYRRHRVDVLRASIVFCVAAMDAYFTDKYCQLLVPYLKKHGPNSRLQERLEKSGFNICQALEMATMKRPYRRISSMMQKRLSKFTTQTTSDINKLYLDFGIDKFLQNVESSVNRKNLLRRVEILVERRHKIVHAGDLNSRSRPNTIDLRDTTSRMKDINELVFSAEIYLDKRLKL